MSERAAGVWDLLGRGSLTISRRSCTLRRPPATAVGSPRSGAAAFVKGKPFRQAKKGLGLDEPGRGWWAFVKGKPFPQAGEERPWP